jgi:hypothetical protein
VADPQQADNGRTGSDPQLARPGQRARRRGSVGKIENSDPQTDKSAVFHDLSGLRRSPRASKSLKNLKRQDCHGKGQTLGRKVGIRTDDWPRFPGTGINNFARERLLEEHIELQLAHQKRNKVAAAYNHAKYLSRRAAMMRWWADYLDAQLAKAEESDSRVSRKRTAIPGKMARIKLGRRVRLPIVTHARALQPTV